MTNLTNEERETLFNQTADDHSIWAVATNDPMWIARIEKLGFAPTKIRGETRWYSVPDDFVHIRAKRQVSEAQRMATKERFAVARDRN